MATTSAPFSGQGTIRLRLDTLLAGQNFGANSSTIRLVAYVVTQGWASSYGNGAIGLVCDGQGALPAGPANWNIGGAGTYEVARRDFTVRHNANGTKSIAVAADYTVNGWGSAAARQSGVAIQAIPQLPSAPASLSASRSVRDVTVTAGAAPSSAPVLEYQVQRSNAGPSGWYATNYKMDGNRRFKFSNFSSGTYRFRARARTARGWGPWRESGNVTVPNTPNAPAVTGARTGRTARATWSPPSSPGDPITGYIAEVSTNNGSSWGQRKSVAASARSAEWPSMPVGGSVKVRVAGVSALGTGAWGTSATVTIGTVPAAPPVTAERNGRGLDAKWTPPSSTDSITGYDAEVSTDNGASWGRSQALGAGVRSASWADLPVGVTARARVRAKSAIGTGAWGTSASVVMVMPPGPPRFTVFAVYYEGLLFTGKSPLNPGDEPVTGYVWEYRVNDGPWLTPDSTYWDGADYIQAFSEVKGNPGDAVHFRVAARSVIGQGPWATAPGKVMPVRMSRRESSVYQPVQQARRFTGGKWVDIKSVKVRRLGQWIPIAATK